MGFLERKLQTVVLYSTSKVPSFAACSGVSLTGPAGTFTSPNHPSNYDNNLDCSWTITVPSGSVTLTFDEFEVEGYSNQCSYDRVVVRGISLSTELF